MRTGTITSKGQITIPKTIRDELGLLPGARVSFLKNTAGFYELHLETRSIRTLAGCLQHSGPPISIEDMDGAIASATPESMQ